MNVPMECSLRLQQLAEQIQDELGEMVAKAFNHCYSKVNCNKHSVMQGLISKCPHCQGTGIDPEIPNYDAPQNSSPTVGNSAAGQSGRVGCVHNTLKYIGPWYSCEYCGTHFNARAEATPEGALPF